MKKYYTATATVERNNVIWEVQISSFINTLSRANELIEEFKNTYLNTDIKVINTKVIR